MAVRAPGEVEETVAESVVTGSLVVADVAVRAPVEVEDTSADSVVTWILVGLALEYLFGLACFLLAILSALLPVSLPFSLSQSHFLVEVTVLPT